MSVLDLTRAGINFLAIDFDLTLVDTHTEGRWPGSPSELAARVRPNLRHLMNEAMDAGIHVAIVTLSPQVPLISAVLQLIFPASCDMIPIRGSDGNWFYAGQGSLEGKQVRTVLESPQFDCVFMHLASFSICSGGVDTLPFGPDKQENIIADRR